jgi:signal transduction histidine kinase
VVINSYTNITERRQAEEALRQLSTRLLQLQDEERRRLGRELHDSLAQSVLAVNLNLAQAAGAMASLDEKSRHALAEARRVLQEMSREIRTLSYLLHPPLLDELGLVSAVKEYAEGFSERSGIRLEVDLQAGFRRLPQDAETALFRILQESLSNIQRHSDSQTAKIHLRGDSNGVSLEIADQGRGMGNTAIELGNGGGTRLGVGILGMRERMIQLGGKLDIESTSSGTTVRATIPLKTEVTNAPAHPRRR